MIATWYVMEDGSVVDPSDIGPDDKGILRHRKDGRAVKMRGDVPHSRSVDVSAHREMRPQPQQTGYITRDGQLSSSDLESLRAEYQKAFDKKPFHGWDAATLREKITTKAE